MCCLQLVQGDDITDSQIYVSSAEADLRLIEDTLAEAQNANRRLGRGDQPGGS